MTIHDPTPAERLAATIAERAAAGHPSQGVPTRFTQGLAQPRHRVMNALQRQRDLAGLSVSAVERETGVRGLKDAERGKNINVRHAIILARFYGLPVEAIWSVPEEGVSDAA